MIIKKINKKNIINTSHNHLDPNTIQNKSNKLNKFNEGLLKIKKLVSDHENELLNQSLKKKKKTVINDDIISYEIFNMKNNIQGIKKKLKNNEIKKKKNIKNNNLSIKVENENKKKLNHQKNKLDQKIKKKQIKKKERREFNINKYTKGISKQKLLNHDKKKFGILNISNQKIERSNKIKKKNFKIDQNKKTDLIDEKDENLNNIIINSIKKPNNEITKTLEDDRTNDLSECSYVAIGNSECSESNVISNEVINRSIDELQKNDSSNEKKIIMNDKISSSLIGKSSIIQNNDYKKENINCNIKDSIIENDKINHFEKDDNINNVLNDSESNKKNDTINKNISKSKNMDILVTEDPDELDKITSKDQYKSEIDSNITIDSNLNEFPNISIEKKTKMPNDASFSINNKLDLGGSNKIESKIKIKNPKKIEFKLQNNLDEKSVKVADTSNIKEIQLDDNYIKDEIFKEKNLDIMNTIGEEIFNDKDNEIMEGGYGIGRDFDDHDNLVLDINKKIDNKKTKKILEKSDNNSWDSVSSEKEDNGLKSKLGWLLLSRKKKKGNKKEDKIILDSNKKDKKEIFENKIKKEEISKESIDKIINEKLSEFMNDLNKNFSSQNLDLDKKCKDEKVDFEKKEMNMKDGDEQKILENKNEGKVFEEKEENLVTEEKKTKLRIKYLKKKNLNNEDFKNEKLEDNKFRNKNIEYNKNEKKISKNMNGTMEQDEIEDVLRRLRRSREQGLNESIGNNLVKKIFIFIMIAFITRLGLSLVQIDCFGC